MPNIGGVRPLPHLRHGRADRPLTGSARTPSDGPAQHDAPIRDSDGVLIEDGRIVRVGDADDGAPEGTITVDLAGKTLLPGISSTATSTASEPCQTSDSAYSRSCRGR